MADYPDQRANDGAAKAGVGTSQSPTPTLQGIGAVARAGGYGIGGYGIGALNTEALNESIASQPMSPETPLPLRVVTTGGLESGTAISSASAGGGEFGTASPTIPIYPTVYSIETVTIQNSITINVGDPALRELHVTLGRLVTAIEGSNELATEVRRQLTAEITAGKALLEAPKVERNAIQQYLINPLRWIAVTAAGVIVTELANHALERDLD
jgi:hypothetical protein